MTDTEYRRNSVSGEQLRGFIERIERFRAEKKELSEQEKVVIAEAKATGFDTKIMQYCVKVRAQKPSDFQEAQALAEMYLSALGMAPEPPLFRAAALMNIDIAAKDQVVDALKKFVPANGSIIVEAGGCPLRLTRDKEGNVSVEEVMAKPEPPHSPAPFSGKPKAEVPATDADGAEALGRQAAKDDMPIIQNPFPFGDARRARWDLGWRKEAGSDGMGPDD